MGSKGHSGAGGAGPPVWGLGPRPALAPAGLLAGERDASGLTWLLLEELAVCREEGRKGQKQEADTWALLGGAPSGRQPGRPGPGPQLLPPGAPQSLLGPPAPSSQGTRSPQPPARREPEQGSREAEILALLIIFRQNLSLAWKVGRGPASVGGAWTLTQAARGRHRERRAAWLAVFSLLTHTDIYSGSEARQGPAPMRVGSAHVWGPRPICPLCLLGVLAATERRTVLRLPAARPTRRTRPPLSRESAGLGEAGRGQVPVLPAQGEGVGRVASAPGSRVNRPHSPFRAHGAGAVAPPRTVTGCPPGPEGGVCLGERGPGHPWQGPWCGGDERKWAALGTAAPS